MNQRRTIMILAIVIVPLSILGCKVGAERVVDCETILPREALVSAEWDTLSRDTIESWSQQIAAGDISDAKGEFFLLPSGEYFDYRWKDDGREHEANFDREGRLKRIVYHFSNISGNQRPTVEDWLRCKELSPDFYSHYRTTAEYAVTTITLYYVADGLAVHAAERPANSTDLFADSGAPLDSVAMFRQGSSLEAAVHDSIYPDTANSQNGRVVATELLRLVPWSTLSD